MAPFISVIVPVYNAEKSLRRCVDSILTQTFTDFELLLVDDGSADGSWEICSEYCAGDPRVRTFRKTNGGVSSARNLGLDNAAGEWITFCDADDFLLKGAFDDMVRRTHDADMVVGGFIHKFIFSDRVSESTEVPTDGGNMVCFISPWAKLFSARIIKDNRLEFNNRFHVLEDADFVVRYLGLMPGSIGQVRKPVYCYMDDKTAELRKYRISTDRYVYQRRCFEESFTILKRERGNVFDGFAEMIQGYLGSLYFKSLLTQPGYRKFAGELTALFDSGVVPYADSSKKRLFYRIAGLSTFAAWLISRLIKNKFI